MKRGITDLRLSQSFVCSTKHDTIANHFYEQGKADAVKD